MSETSADLERQSNVNSYLSLISFTLLYYDYFITLPDEVSRFWAHRRWSWASFLFYLNRYSALALNIPVAIEYLLGTALTPQKLVTCHQLQSLHQYYSIIAQVIVAVMLIMRTYALYEFKKWVLILMLIVTGAALGFGLWTFLGSQSSQPINEELPRTGCPASLTKEQSIRIGAGWAGMVVFDVMIFSLTLAKAISFRSRSSHGLLTLLIRDGTVYFAIMIASNVGNIMTFMFGGTRIRGCAMTFTNVVSTIMMTRLMLNLRDPQLIEPSAGRTSGTAVSSPTITTLVDRTGFTSFTTGFLTEATHSGVQRLSDGDDHTRGAAEIELAVFSRHP